MTATWTVLASGSGGNASLLKVNGAGLLVDFGLGPRQFGRRLDEIGAHWEQVRGVVLTHTHSDHWNARSLAQLVERRIPMYCHADHLRTLQLECRAFQDMQFTGLAKTYQVGRPFTPIAGVRCRAIALRHDGGPTFGFRIEAESGETVPQWAVGYAADLGSWDRQVSAALADVDLLALEFNHDVDLQLASGRARWLIHRVLGDYGHLSNVQGARLFEECVQLSTTGRLKHLIQLHLSGQCNRPALAVAAARGVIAKLGLDVVLHTAEQDAPGMTIPLSQEVRQTSLRATTPAAVHQFPFAS